MISSSNSLKHLTDRISFVLSRNIKFKLFVLLPDVYFRNNLCYQNYKHPYKFVEIFMDSFQIYSISLGYLDHLPTKIIYFLGIMQIGANNLQSAFYSYSPIKSNIHSHSSYSEAIISPVNSTNFTASMMNANEG